MGSRWVASIAIVLLTTLELASEPAIKQHLASPLHNGGNYLLLHGWEV